MTENVMSRRTVLRLAALASGVGAAITALGSTNTSTERALATEPHDVTRRVTTSRPATATPSPQIFDVPQVRQISHVPHDPQISQVPHVRQTSQVPQPRQHPDTHPAKQPRWLNTWRQPIDSLDDFERRSDVRFPRRAIMLTIDDGPDAEWTPKYLRLLARYHVSATFNMIGEQVHAQRKLVRAVANEGHHIGNHTFTHPLNLPYLDAATIRTELENTTDAIVRASGFRPRQFRAPGGVWGPDVFAEAARQGMAPLGWDIDPRDWALPGVQEIKQAMLAARPHDIVLCHDGGGDRHETFEALKTVIPAILARGWTFVTLPAPPTI